MSERERCPTCGQIWRKKKPAPEVRIESLDYDPTVNGICGCGREWPHGGTCRWRRYRTEHSDLPSVDSALVSGLRGVIRPRLDSFGRGSWARMSPAQYEEEEAIYNASDAAIIDVLELMREKRKRNFLLLSLRCRGKKFRQIAQALLISETHARELMEGVLRFVWLELRTRGQAPIANESKVER
jgi:hypothetical protein